MPELPEVETIVNELRPFLVGRTFTGAKVEWPGTLAGMNPANFADRLTGQRVARVARRAKYILIYLEGGDVLVVHLRMTGRLLLRKQGEEADRFLRLTLPLDNGEELRFADLRKFGRVTLVSAEEVPALLAKLGPEPLGDEFDVAAFAAIVGKRRAPIKTVLLNQALLAGLGNIYADEALFLAGIHPLRRADSLSAEELARLHAGVRKALGDGIANRGTTFSDYRDARGNAGKNQESLNVYRRTSLPCPRCGAPVERLVVGGRSTHFCPSCQPAPEPEKAS